MSSWIVTTQDDEYWSIRSPSIQIPNSTSANKVAGTEDCDNVCTMILVDNVDLTQMILPELSFYRFVGTGADIRDQEGIIAHISINGGDTWNILERFTADEFDDDGVWHKEKYDLNDYSSTQFKVKFDGISNSNREDTELDDVIIYDASADVSTDTTPPTITAPSNKIIEVTGMFTLLGIAQISSANATDNADSNPAITSDTPESFPLGITIVTYTATDSSGNNASATQSVIVADTTPPVFVGVRNQIVTGNNLVFPINYTIPGITDNIYENLTVHCSPSALTTPGQTTIHCIASDGSGNTAETSFRITIPQTVLLILEPITTDSCSIHVQFGTTVEFSLEQCDSEYVGVKYISIPRSTHYGNVAISADKTTLLITAPDSAVSSQMTDEFGVTINAMAYNQPRVDVAVIYYE